MKKFIIPLVLISVVAISCRQVFGKKVRGSGTIKTETRNIGGLNSVDARGSIEVYLTNDSTASVRIETDDNLVEHVETYEEGGVLFVEVEKGFNLRPTNEIKVHISAPEFRKVRASGACDIFTSGRITSSESIAIRLSGATDADLDIKAPRVTGDLSGAGTLRLKGETRDLELEGTGSSNLECFGMKAENVSVQITGAGDADVFASVSLDVKVTGSGSVKYKGSPSVNQKISGAGSVRKVND
jgi:hypothetical protein